MLKTEITSTADRFT